MAAIALDDVFALWGSIPEMAAAVDESHWTVAKWKERNRIPQDYWPAVIAAAKRKGKDLSADDLLTMHFKRRRGGGSERIRA